MTYLPTWDRGGRLGPSSNEYCAWVTQRVKQQLGERVPSHQGEITMIYILLLMFFLLPVTVVAYLRIKAGRYPLPRFCNNVVANRLKLRKAIGIASPILFWCLHFYLLVLAFQSEAWVAALILIAYMVASTLLWREMKAKDVVDNPDAAEAGGQPSSHPEN